MATRSLTNSVDDLAGQTSFSGVVRVDVSGDIVVDRAYGLADRRLAAPCTNDTIFAIASGAKGFTALAVVSLVADGIIGLDTTARSLLGGDLPMIDDRVTVEMLLAHRSGIGDYLDEDLPWEINDHMMTRPVHELATTEAYLPMLDGLPNKFAPGDRFSYCNGGFVVLALLAERATGTPLADLVDQRVCGPAGLTDTAFLRSDELPARAAIGYLAAEGMRTNVLHLPVRGSGDGGIYTTTADVHALWQAFFDGAIVPERWVHEMVRERSDVPSESRRYGLGFWLHHAADAAMLVGFDAGVSFSTTCDPARRLTSTVISNTSDGVWPIARLLDSHFGL